MESTSNLIKKAYQRLSHFHFKKNKEFFPLKSHKCTCHLLDKTLPLNQKKNFMKAQKYSHQTIDEIIGSKEVAIAGVSRNPKNFGNVVYKTLKEKGFTVYPINPNAVDIDGEKTYQSVSELPDRVKNLVVLLKPADVSPVVGQAIQKGINKIWLQQGSTNQEAIEKAKNANVEMVTNKCILMYASPSGIHKFHSSLSKFFGKY